MKREQGFTIVEVIVAILVLTVAFWRWSRRRRW